jgi:hypothetical protein
VACATRWHLRRGGLHDAAAFRGAAAFVARVPAATETIV